MNLREIKSSCVCVLVCVWQALKMAMQNFWLEAAKVLVRALLLEVVARRQSNALRLFYTFLVFFCFFGADSSRVSSRRNRLGAVGTIGLGALVNCKPSFGFDLARECELNSNGGFVS